jgi:hypothetical protein
VPGQVRRIGGWWIESADNPAGTPDGESLTFTNWRSGEQRALGPASGRPPRDLDDPGLGVAVRPYRLRRLAGGRTAIHVRRGDRWPQLAHCRAACGDVLVWRRRVAFVDPERGQLIERRPRHTTRWRVPRALGGATLHRARNALVLAHRAGPEPGPWQIWRADRR